MLIHQFHHDMRSWIPTCVSFKLQRVGIYANSELHMITLHNVGKKKTAQRTQIRQVRIYHNLNHTLDLSPFPLFAKYIDSSAYSTAIFASLGINLKCWCIRNRNFDLKLERWLTWLDAAWWDLT